MRLHYPLDRVKITQQFGERPTVYKPLLGHNGVDFRTLWDDSPEGERAVYAAAPGIVELGNQGHNGYGTFIKIIHPDGSQTLYGHLSKQCVSVGQQVTYGTKIGITGATGFVDAPHLHFGYRPPLFSETNGFGGYVNPLLYMDTSISIPYFEQVSGQAPIYAYDPTQDKMVAFADGNIFKMMFGDYPNTLIHHVAQLSKPVASQQLKIT